MAFDRGQVEALAGALLETFDAVADGVGVDDIDEAVGLLTAFGSAQDEIREDTDAALLLLASALLARIGERRLDVS